MWNRLLDLDCAERARSGAPRLLCFDPSIRKSAIAPATTTKPLLAFLSKYPEGRSSAC